MNGVFPVSRSRQRRFRLCPRSSRIAPPASRRVVPCISLASCPSLAELAPYPGRGAFRCRSIGALGQRRTLTRPVLPPRTLLSASGGFRPLRHFPRSVRRCWQSFLMKHRGPFSGLTLRLNPLAIHQYPIRYCYRMFGRGFKFPPPCDEFFLIPSLPLRGAFRLSRTG